MKRVIPVLAATALAVASLALVVSAEAQMGPGYGRGYGPGFGPGGFRGANAGDIGANAQARLADLHTRLGITAAQEPAWQAYADAVTAQAGQMQAFRDQMFQSNATGPDRAALMSQHMQQRLTGHAAVTQAYTALYAGLTAEQRAVFEQQCPRGAGGRWGSGPFG